jgi:TM2 domain-containing membrane protein YozV
MKSKLIAYLLWFFLGFISMHRFYLGKVGSGLLYLVTFQLFGIGWLVDAFRLGDMVDNYNNERRIEQLERGYRR